MFQQILSFKKKQDVENGQPAFPFYYLVQVIIVLAIAFILSFSGVNGLIIAIAVICAAGLIILGLKAPWMLLMITLLLSSLNGVFSGIKLPGVESFSFGTLINGSALAGTLISLSLHIRSLRWRMITPYRWFLIFALWSVLGVLIAPSISVAVKDVVLYWIPVLSVILTRLITEKFPKNINRIEHYFLWINVIPLFILIAGLAFQFIQITHLGIVGFFYARQLTLYLLVPLSLALSWWRLGVSRQERFWGFLWTVVLMTVILVGLSRTVIVAGIFLVLLRFFPPKRIGHWVFILIVGLLLFVAILQVPQYRNRFLFNGQITSTEINWSTINTNGRSFLWPIVFNDSLKSPLIGLGTGSSRVLVKSVSPLESPLNDYLRIFHDLGLVGLALFFLAWGSRMLKDWLMWTRMEKVSPSIAKYRMASFLGALAIGISFITDSTIVYSFVLIPLFTLFALTDSACLQESKNGPE